MKSLSEVWKNIPGFSGYMVSDKGRVKSIDHATKYPDGHEQCFKGRVRKLVSVGGYLTVDIKRRTYKVHRLVAIAFIPNPDNKPHINHINGNKLDNRIENLEWVTQSENTKHAYDTGLSKMTKEIKSKISKSYRRYSDKLTPEMKDEIYASRRDRGIGKKKGVQNV